jgi:hypothetical protein
MNAVGSESISWCWSGAPSWHPASVPSPRRCASWGWRINPASAATTKCSTGRVGRPRRGASIVAPSSGGAVAQRRGGDRRRRYRRATLGRQNQGTRYLSRCRALVAWPFRQGQRIALAVAGGDVAGTLRRPTLGTPFPDCAGAGGALERGRHKALTDWARQAILQTKRWLPDRRVVVVADSGFSALVPPVIDSAANL